jgi:hypothetical protein
MSDSETSRQLNLSVELPVIDLAGDYAARWVS